MDFSITNSQRAFLYACFIYIFIIISLYQTKPSYFFDETNQPKKWGVGSDKILFPIYIVATVFGIISLFVFNIIIKD